MRRNFRPVQLIGTVTPVPVLAGLHRAHVCDRFFAVLPGPEPGETELEAVVLRYQLPLPPLRQRPQLQIYARMPAQALDVMQFCDSCLYLKRGARILLNLPTRSCNSPLSG
jgi:hypothetical protein